MGKQRSLPSSRNWGDFVHSNRRGLREERRSCRLTGRFAHGRGNSLLRAAVMSANYQAKSSADSDDENESIGGMRKTESI